MSRPEDRERGRLLLAIARESLAEALGLGRTADADYWGDPWLREPGACFVTLRRDGKLRGCVGSVRAWRALLDDVRHNTRAAAFSDTRFSPVVPQEFDEIGVELSLLSEPEPLAAACEEEALALLRPGLDGVIFECADYRSTFLPQVWEQLPDPREFLDQLRYKAGLPPGYWSPEVRIFRYTVAKWVEE